MQKEVLVGFWENASYLKIASSNRYKTRRRRRRRRREECSVSCSVSAFAGSLSFCLLIMETMLAFFSVSFFGFFRISKLCWDINGSLFVSDLKLFARIEEEERFKRDQITFWIFHTPDMYVCIYFSSVGCFANGLQSCQGVMSL